MNSIKLCGTTISNPQKIVFKTGKITKLDVANYYAEIAPLMLKFLRNRLLTVVRCHSGNGAACFFKKHPLADKPHVKTFLLDGQEYFYLTTQKEIVFQAQMGTVEFHIWGCNVKNINHPNLMVLDLDPDPNLPLAKLRQGCKILKAVLDKLNLKSYLKTSGGKGYHLCVNLTRKLTWQQLEELSHQIALLLEAQHPELFTTTIKKLARKNKIFVDYLRNKKGATCVAPFSIRARANAPISMPIKWSALNKIAPNQINIKNYKSYLKFLPKF